MTAATATTEAFDPVMTMGLPEPAGRWLGHAIAPGTPLWERAELTMQTAELQVKRSGRLAEITGAVFS